MDNEGPQLETLLRRLSECPIEFIETCKTPTGLIQLIAILSDHFREFGDVNPLKKERGYSHGWMATPRRATRVQ